MGLNYKQMVYSREFKREILFEGIYKNFNFYILSFGMYPTAYIEIPKTHKLFGKSYNEIYDMGIDIEVHGGLTYSAKHITSIKYNSWFIGWDYAHYGDYIEGLYNGRTNKKWTTEEIFEDVVRAIEQIKEEENE